MRARSRRRDPDTADAVMASLARDHRWMWWIDERAGYLAALVRDLRMPIAPLLALLDRYPDDDNDPDNTFENVLDVLVRLGRLPAGPGPEAAGGLRRYLAEGPRWLVVLQEIAGRMAGGVLGRPAPGGPDPAGSGRRRRPPLARRTLGHVGEA
ncbi:hypothetical protein [Actinoplanes couchii]|uniref:Uncharacterized protein n=1 Tax=Actinoplanes couchii TaxID=403638 RepID=A0ABQ3X078_9ACTN|nr:hypothetical protein [Actinoplanes couchii]MDR6316312.1 hypothetical protein [Actinoplanes couchii]GID51925.1 hypothetical protein Aco03nite_003290 [Actinoplanes couchii]